MIHRFFTPIPLIGLIHVVQGLSAMLTTHVLVSGLSGFTLTGASPRSIGFLLICVGAMAIVARLAPDRRVRLALIAPQQIVLFVQFFGIAVALIEGAYPDGYVPVPGNWLSSFGFILEDQVPMIALCFSHLLDVVFAERMHKTREYYEQQLAETNEQLASARQIIGLVNDTEFWLTTKWDGPNPLG